MKEKKLTDKQARFCREYMKDSNATQAAIRAGYSASTAQEQSSRLLSKVIIQQRLKVLKDKAAKRNDITVDRILQELKYIAFGRITDVAEFDNQGVKFKNSDDLSDEVARAISEVGSKDTKEGVELKLKMYDKQKALSMLMEYTGMKKAPDQTGNIDQIKAKMLQLSPDELRTIISISTKLEN